ncbi:calcium/calmodulin-dependent protein kinase [Fusarium flagelliforme]|uniref:Calcium/calmodulin-dependent protein kinase n=1 Tax=Fusarium flagelliforme TaxID=2675880 RepID=A0A395MEF7_9HYPO|nr:calcium/calmodulin-dependent protein kinase [Fusarium flagelliforme]
MKPPEDSLQGTIYSATQACRKSLRECLEVGELMQNEWAENRLADFNLWASGLGASVQGRASLDARLASRPDARDAVANLLQVLNGAVKDCQALGSAESTSAGCDEDHPTSDSEEDPPRSFSPWSDDSDSDTDLESTLNDSPLQKAKETVNSLLDLLIRIAITIRRSGTQSRLRKADRKFKAEDHEELQRHLIVLMLSQGPFSSDHTFSPDQTDQTKLTAIQWRLINCNLKRRNRFLYAQRHSEALETPKNPLTQQDATPQPEVPNLPARPIVSVPLQKPSANCPASPAKRTGLFSRYKNKSIYYGYQVTISSSTQGCPSPEVLHVTRKAWESHLRDDHGSTDMWTCFACIDSLQFEAEADFLAHTLQEHGETISEGKIHALAAACKTSITAEITSCPLCAWPTLKEAEISQISVLDHIAEHVHAFSLRAFPWAPDAEHETDVGIQRAVSKVEPWLTKHNLTSESLTIIESSTTTPVASSPAPHYFDTHDYFAEGSENSSCSTVSDGTIERELRKGQSPVYGEVYVESYYESDEVESDGANDGSQEEDDEDDLAIALSVKRVPRKLYVANEARGDLVDLEDVDDDDEVVERSAGAEESDVSEPIDDGEYVSRLSSWPEWKGYANMECLIRPNYGFGRTISSGNYSAVYEAQSREGRVAIRSIMESADKSRVWETYQEIELWQHVKHPNIVRFVDWFELNDTCYIVTDLAEGGDLFDRVREEGTLSEPDAQRTMRDILMPIEYLHYQGIFGYLTKDKGSSVTLISLAHADWEKTEQRAMIPIDPRMLPSKDKHFGAFAPEIMLQERSGKPADMWSIGAIAYFMLAGYSPFRSENLNDLIRECTQGVIVFHERYWKDISDKAKDFIRRCLQPKPEDRLTMQEALRHPWIVVGRRNNLMRVRWKCIILKVQLGLQIRSSWRKTFQAAVFARMAVQEVERASHVASRVTIIPG